MSLLNFAKRLVKKAAPVLGSVLPGPLGTVAKVAGVALGAGKAVAVAGKRLPALPAVTRALPGIGKVGTAVGAAATGVAVYDAAGQYLGNRKKRRRMNPLNSRALNRALKRVEKVKETMKRVNAISIRKEKC